MDGRKVANIQPRSNSTFKRCVFGSHTHTHTCSSLTNHSRRMLNSGGVHPQPSIFRSQRRSGQPATPVRFWGVSPRPDPDVSSQRDPVPKVTVQTDVKAAWKGHLWSLRRSRPMAAVAGGQARPRQRATPCQQPRHPSTGPSRTLVAIKWRLRRLVGP